jgi:arginase
MAIRLLGVPTRLGIPRTERESGSQALRRAGLLASLYRMGQTVHDLGELPVPGPAAPLPELVAVTASRQADLLTDSWLPGDQFLVAGGDHSASLGTLTALRRLGIDCDIIWIDAHADFNTPRTSPSGNPHGMVLAMASGLLPACPPVIDPSRVKLLGVREIDPGERELLRRCGVTALSPEELRNRWDEVINGLRENVYISFDVDAVDPAEAPATLTPVPGGLTGREVLALVRQIARRRRLVALDLMEYHPDLEQDGRTASLLLDITEAALSLVGRAAVASD